MDTLLPSANGAAAHLSPRDRLLDAATDLFCRVGIHAVGVDAIVAQARTAKATLYKTFGSKEALVEAVLDREGRAWREWFIGGLDEGRTSARERLDRIPALLAAWFRQERFYGCPFINAVGEHDKDDNRMRRLALVHKGAVLGRIESLLREAGAADPSGLSHQVGLVVDGAIVAALITRDATVADAAAATLRCLLDGTLPRPRHGRARSRSGRGER